MESKNGWETYIDENGTEYWIITEDNGEQYKVSKEFLRKCFDHAW